MQESPGCFAQVAGDKYLVHVPQFVVRIQGVIVTYSCVCRSESLRPAFPGIALPAAQDTGTGLELITVQVNALHAAAQ